jgi:hypothetical protein
VRKGTPAAKYLKLVLNVIVIDGLRFAERTVTSDAVAECPEIGAIIGRPQPGPMEGYDVQANSKGAQPPKPKLKPPPPRPPRPPAKRRDRVPLSGTRTGDVTFRCQLRKRGQRLPDRERYHAI